MRRTITREELNRRLRGTPPDNYDRDTGYALVNVLAPEDFAFGHIPGSVNIPRGNEGEYAKRFGRTKEIIVYCASLPCTASTTAVDELVRRGFSNVVEYEGGMEDWETGGGEVEVGQSEGFGCPDKASEQASHKEGL